MTENQASDITVDLLLDLWQPMKTQITRRHQIVLELLDDYAPASVHGTDITLCGEHSAWEEVPIEVGYIEAVLGRLLNQRVSLKFIVRPQSLAEMPYDKYLKSDHWKETAAGARERAGYRCQVCNSAGSLQVHHRTYERRGEELPDDLIVLCAGCHQLFHDNRKLARQ